MNAAAPGSPPATSFTYDPSGNTTVSGSANSWPFEFMGLEHEITDPANLYFLPSSNVYNPQMQADLSQVGPQGLSNSGGGSGGYSPAGGYIPPPSGPGRESYWKWVENQDLSAGESLGGVSMGSSEGGSTYVPAGGIVYGIESLVSFFEWLFSNGSSPPIPRQLMHARHPLYGVILGILEGLIANESSPMFEVYAALGAGPSNFPPLQRGTYAEPGVVTVQFWGYSACGPGNNGEPTQPGTVDNCCNAHDSCYDGFGLTAGNMTTPGSSASGPQQACDSQLCDCVGKARVAGPFDYLMRFGIRKYFRCQ